jgi:hypothetical protein
MRETTAGDQQSESRHHEESGAGSWRAESEARYVVHDIASMLERFEPFAVAPSTLTKAVFHYPCVLTERGIDCLTE